MATTSIGTDIKEVYQELGANFTIINRTPVVTGEKILYDMNTQATKPFIREHFIDCTFPYDTSVEVGDIIVMPSTQRYYMVMNKTPELFEDAMVEWAGILYLCNLPTTARIVRPLEIRDSQSYDMVSSWVSVVDSPIYGILSDRVFGSSVDPGIIEGQSLIWRIDCFLPKWYNVQPLDRIIISPTEYYKIETIQSYYYPGSNINLLCEDTRPATNFLNGEIYND